MYLKKPHILIALELSSSIIHSFYPPSVFYIFFFRLCFMYMYPYYIYFKFHVYCTDCFFISNYYFYLTTEAEPAFSSCFLS